MDAARALARVSTAATRRLAPVAVAAARRVRAALDERVARLLGRDFDERLRRVRVHAPPGGVDPFGLDPSWARYALGVSALFHRVYFRTEVHGIDAVPKGRVLLVANHSGQVPFDGLVLAAAMFLDADPPRVLRSMVEKWTQSLPFVSVAFSRLGQVLGVPENARRLLQHDEALLVFPEGSRGIAKPFSRRYRLEEFGLGFMRLALETQTPIVPVAVVGAEEQYVSLANLEGVARSLGMPSFPIVPQLLLPGGQLPLPVRYRLHFGAALRFEGDPDDDDAVVADKVLEVRRAIEALLERGLRERRAIFY